LSHLTLNQLWFSTLPKLPYPIKREAVCTGSYSWWPLALSRRLQQWQSNPEKDPAYNAICDTKQRIDAGDCRAITINDERYPALLRAIPNPPLILFYVGDIELLSLPALAVVGGRICTAPARAICRRWIPQIADRGLVVVSGLARGIDAEAHAAALSSNGSTVAVLAGGLGRLYPPEHNELYKNIAERGCVITEQLWSRSAKRYDFPKRNRIVSGLCAVTLVVEASLKSGSLITARHALAQGREVAAAPISPLAQDLQGANQLIKDGACLVTGAEDILDLYDDLPLRNDDIATVLQAIGGGAVGVDDICSVTSLEERVVWASLATLELDDLVAQKNGLWYRLSTG